MSDWGKAIGGLTSGGLGYVAGKKYDDNHAKAKELEQQNKNLEVGNALAGKTTQESQQYNNRMVTIPKELLEKLILALVQNQNQNQNQGLNFQA